MCTDHVFRWKCKVVDSEGLPHKVEHYHHDALRNWTKCKKVKMGEPCAGRFEHIWDGLGDCQICGQPAYPNLICDERYVGFRSIQMTGDDPFPYGDVDSMSPMNSSHNPRGLTYNPIADPYDYPSEYSGLENWSTYSRSLGGMQPHTVEHRRAASVPASTVAEESSALLRRKKNCSAHPTMREESPPGR